MRIEDARKIVAVLMVTYQNYKPIDADLAAKIWADLTEEYSYEQVDAGLKAYMRSNTSGFAPVPSQVVEVIQSMIIPENLNEMEAWALVRNAISRSTYNSVEEFSKLPPLVQKAVGLPDQLRVWAMDENYNEDVISSNFVKCYRAAAQREKEIQKMPTDIKKAIEMTNKEFYFAQIEDLRAKMIGSLNERQAEVKAIDSVADGIQIPNWRDKLLELFDGK